MREISVEEVLEIFVDAISEYYTWSRFVDARSTVVSYDHPGLEIRRRAKKILQKMQDDENYRNEYNPGDLIELTVGGRIKDSWVQKLDRY